MQQQQQHFYIGEIKKKIDTIAFYPPRYKVMAATVQKGRHSNMLPLRKVQWWQAMYRFLAWRRERGF